MHRMAITLLVLLGCGEPATPAPEVAVAPVAPASGTELEVFFPLVDGHIYTYATESDDDAGRLVVRARRSGADRGALVTGSTVREFAYAADGVVLERPGAAPVHVLKSPLAPGAQWRGEHGGTVSIAEVGARVTVPAGTFQNCVKTVELRGGDRPMQVATTFCPEVGIVLLEASSGEQLERASLESYGPPIDIGPGGVKVIPPSQ
jgi:hypothetical protein